jgi:predicted phosphate transport protein (TIGR00153 family)
MNNSFLNKLVPKEPKFFPVLKEMSTTLLTASDLMIEGTQNSNHDSAIEFYKKIKEQEKKGDVLTNKIFDDLNSTFITPFDREDIHDLANTLDDVLDYMNSCAKRIVLYNPNNLPSSAIELAKLLKEAVILINNSIDELEHLKTNSKKIKEYCNQIHTIESKADDVYEDFLIELFEREKDCIELVKVKEVMFELEKATDATERVAKIFKTIIVKYA